MKNLIFAAIAALATVSMNSANTITMGDSVRINPNRLSGYYQHKAVMHIDAYADTWQMAVTYPEGLTPKLVAGVTPLAGMNVDYLDRNGVWQSFIAPLNVSVMYKDISSHVGVDGYWDYNMDGELESYGTAKWEAGSHELFEYNLYVAPGFRSGYITFDGSISSGSDRRGAILANVVFFSRTYFWVGYLRGDVTGNDKHNIDDVSALIDYLLMGEGLDEFQVAAADVNQDGRVSIADVSALTDMLLKK